MTRNQTRDELRKAHLRNNARRYQELHMPEWPSLPHGVREGLLSGALTLDAINPALWPLLPRFGHLRVYRSLVRNAN